MATDLRYRAEVDAGNHLTSFFRKLVEAPVSKTDSSAS
jgi:hypothetical protein